MAIQEIKNYVVRCDLCGDYAEQDITPIPPDDNWNYIRSWYKDHRMWTYKKINGTMVDVCPICNEDYD